MPVAVYYSKLSVLWDELDKLEPLIVCECGNCTCDLGKKLIARRDGDRLQQFLLGLYTEYYSSIRSNLLNRDPLPSLNRAFQSVAQEERVRGPYHSKDEHQLVCSWFCCSYRGRKGSWCFVGKAYRQVW